MSHMIYDANPNQVTGGKACLYGSPTDCRGPYRLFPGRIHDHASPLPVICAYHAQAVLADFEKAVRTGHVHRAKVGRGAIPPDPRIRGQRPHQTEQEESPNLTDEELGAMIKAAQKKPRRTRARKTVEDTPDI